MQPKPSLLAGAIALASWVKNPAKAWKAEKEQWRDYASYRTIRRLGLIECLESRPSEAIPPKYNDLANLYRLAMKRGPKVILELGGGCSTFVLAAAAQKLNGTLYSVDQSERWQSLVKDAMPQRLAPFVKYHLADVMPCTADGLHAYRYESLPIKDPNLIYIDGGSAKGQPIWADAWLIEETGPPDFSIVVDGRQNTRAFFNEHLRRVYHIKRNDNQTVYEPY